jgi:hypothetical protein
LFSHNNNVVVPQQTTTATVTNSSRPGETPPTKEIIQCPRGANNSSSNAYGLHGTSHIPTSTVNNDKIKTTTTNKKMVSERFSMNK